MSVFMFFRTSYYNNIIYAVQITTIFVTLIIFKGWIIYLIIFTEITDTVGVGYKTEWWLYDRNHVWL